MCIVFLRKQLCGGGRNPKMRRVWSREERGSQQAGMAKGVPRKRADRIPGCELGSVLNLNKNIECSRNEGSSLNTTNTTTTNQ